MVRSIAFHHGHCNATSYAVFCNCIKSGHLVVLILKRHEHRSSSVINGMTVLKNLPSMRCMICSSAVKSNGESPRAGKPIEITLHSSDNSLTCAAASHSVLSPIIHVKFWRKLHFTVQRVHRHLWNANIWYKLVGGLCNLCVNLNMFVSSRHICF